jgi:hypothetical protein
MLSSAPCQVLSKVTVPTPHHVHPVQVRVFKGQCHDVFDLLSILFAYDPLRLPLFAGDEDATIRAAKLEAARIIKTAQENAEVTIQHAHAQAGQIISSARTEASAVSPSGSGDPPTFCSYYASSISTSIYRQYESLFDWRRGKCIS